MILSFNTAISGIPMYKYRREFRPVTNTANISFI